MLLLVVTLYFSFFPPLVYCLTFIVSKFQGSMSNSLTVALIWSISCICGFDWKSLLFIINFFSKFLSFQNGLSFRCRIGLKLKIIQCSFCNYLAQSVSPSVHLLSVFPTICLSPSICPLDQNSSMVTFHWWEDFESLSLSNTWHSLCITAPDCLLVTRGDIVMPPQFWLSCMNKVMVWWFHFVTWQLTFDKNLIK